MKYFIMGWVNDSESAKYRESYFIGDGDGRIRLFNSAIEAKIFGRESCKHFNVCSWHNYMSGSFDQKVQRLEVAELVCKRRHVIVIVDQVNTGENTNRIGENAANCIRFMNLMSD